MIVFFEAADFELNNANEDELELLFSELLRASLRGHHYVLIERRTCEWALQRLSLNRKEAAHLHFLKQGYTQRGAIRNISNCQLIVGISAAGLQQVGEFKYQIGHKALLRGNYLDEPVLLVENSESDGTLIHHALKSVQRDHPIKDFSFIVRHGGGSTIVTCFDAELRAKRVTVCIVDSDKISPCSSPSSTVRALHKTADLGTFVGGVFVTRCREIENHLPLELIKRHRLCVTFPDFDILEEIIRRPNGNDSSEACWLYFDLKKGLSGDALLSKPLAQDVEKWLRETFSDESRSLEATRIAGFGDAILSQFLNSGPAMQDLNEHTKSQFWQSVFAPWFKEISWFFAAEKKKAVI